jgi:cytochrome c oxidase cbb3-type subunit 3
VLTLAATCLLLAALSFPAADQPDGADLFKHKCSMCHGAEGKGYPQLKTPDFTDPKWQEGITDEQITETIKNGKKGTPMPPFAEKLKEEEIQALVAHIRSLNSAKKK